MQLKVLLYRVYGVYNTSDVMGRDPLVLQVCGYSTVILSPSSLI